MRSVFDRNVVMRRIPVLICFGLPCTLTKRDTNWPNVTPHIDPLAVDIAPNAQIFPAYSALNSTTVIRRHSVWWWTDPDQPNSPPLNTTRYSIWRNALSAAYHTATDQYLTHAPDQSHFGHGIVQCSPTWTSNRIYSNLTVSNFNHL